MSKYLSKVGRKTLLLTGRDEKPGSWGGRSAVTSLVEVKEKTDKDRETRGNVKLAASSGGLKGGEVPQQGGRGVLEGHAHRKL